jgi:hypothetical protein
LTSQNTLQRTLEKQQATAQALAQDKHASMARALSAIQEEFFSSHATVRYFPFAFS